MTTIFRQNIKTDTLTIWVSFLEVYLHVPDYFVSPALIDFQYMFYHKDPRRVQPLMDFIVDAFTHLDFNAELSFDAVKVISLFSAVFEVLGRKFAPWTDEIVERSWVEVHGEHDDVCIKRKMFWVMR
jgi:proteasome activator subunit 4